MIIFHNEKRMFHLKTPATSYVLRIYGESVLEHVYWGKRIDDIEGMYGFKGEVIPFSAVDKEYENRTDLQSISTDCFPQEYSFFGSCDMRKPAFHAEYEDGSRITKATYVSHRIYSGKSKLMGLPATYAEDDKEAETLEITMQDRITGLTFIHRYTVFKDYDVICRNVEVINNGNKSIKLKSIMSCCIDFERNDFDFINLSGAWGRERHVERRHLGNGTTKIESRRGASSHRHSPFFALADEQATELQGDVYAFSLVYSGNFEAGAEVDTIGQTRAFIGINSFDFLWKLEPGETFTAPETVMVYSDAGFGKMSRTYHTLYRKRLARGRWRDKERPVLINNWEATYFDFDEEKIIKIAEFAKKAGIELLCLDDGWFGHRNNDKCSLGDWYANEEKLPNGISGIAKRINDIGLKFGLWFEPEMISVDSDLYREHPDWCLHVAERERSECRNQLILDLSRIDVQDYIISVMTKHLSSAPIAYVKWDMNRNMTCAGSALLPAECQAEVCHRYILGLYRVLETLITNFPDVLFEGCSGGGGRFDAGQMHYFAQYWTSDNTDAIERMYIQHGTSMVMPTSFMASHVSVVPNHQVGRITPLQTRGYVAMNGQLGYELDITSMTDEELIEIAEQIKEYKNVRELIHNGEMYRLYSPFEGNQVGWMYVSEDKSRAVMFYFTIQNKTSKVSTLVKAAGLDENKIYKLSLNGKLYSGATLMNYGIRIVQHKDAGSDMLIFEEIQ